MQRIRMLFLLLIVISPGIPLKLSGQPLKEVPSYALKPGDKAPPIHADVILQAPDGGMINWQELRDHVVILDFWATWCPPCVADLPHLNTLIEKYRTNHAVRFIVVGHETPGKVKAFLKKHQIDTWILLDTSLSMFNSFTAYGIPHAVIVDRQGVVAAVLNPHDLTEETIDLVLEGEKPVVPQLPPEAYWNPTTAAEYFRVMGREQARSKK
jgi:thiol-disulfide isomerase/thioredoxin